MVEDHLLLMKTQPLAPYRECTKIVHRLGEQEVAHLAPEISCLALFTIGGGKIYQLFISLWVILHMPLICTWGL